MRYLTQAVVQRMLARTDRDGGVVMCDFDGTLAAIVPDPKSARISNGARRALRACTGSFIVAILSGRALPDVRRRSGIRGAWYVGNHGLEWALGAKRGRARLPFATMRALRSAWRELEKLARRYPGIFLEDKRLSLSVHVRRVHSSHAAPLRSDIRKALAPFAQKLVAKEGQEYVYNVRPKKGPDKGGAARLVRQNAPRRAFPVFIGDDETDEDAFKALKTGITIRVGKRRGSAARYYVRTRAEVDGILNKLAESAVRYADTRKR
ncbi:trehalose-phosphatase [Candidatus Kaiserbacteria bacterium]|nr:trehalose-phosphatase [Candidatus Kaiserbacteria bacterium]